MFARGSNLAWIERKAAALLLLLACAVLLAQFTPASASDAKAASIILDANTGLTLHAHNVDEPRYPASLTKMMTLYMVFDAIKQGKASPSTRITVSERAANAPPSKIGFDAGDTITVKDAVLALITKSANDVAIAVAEHFSGSEHRFAEAMTRKARAIGMQATTFRNASGLPDASQMTTPRDMITLALRLFDDHPEYYPAFATRTFVYRGKRYNNHNALLRHFNGTDGMKTGYIRASGFNVVTSVRRGRRHLIGAYFGAPTAAARDSTMRALLTKALLRAATTRTRRTGPILVRQPRIAPRPAPVVAAPATPQPQPADRITMVNVRSVPVDPPRAAAPRRASPDPTPHRQPRPAVEANPLPPPPITAPEPVRAAAPRHDAPVLQKGPALAGPVRQPSTLAAQARQLEGGNPVAGARMGVGAAPRPVAYQPAQSGHEIQIGAHRSETEAHNALRAVQSRAGQLLSNAQPITRQTRTAKGIVYRSRFTGFEPAIASSTCLELRRMSIDCFVARPE